MIPKKQIYDAQCVNKKKKSKQSNMHFAASTKEQEQNKKLTTKKIDTFSLKERMNK